MEQMENKHVPGYHCPLCWHLHKTLQFCESDLSNSSTYPTKYLYIFLKQLVYNDITVVLQIYFIYVHLCYTVLYINVI